MERGHVLLRPGGFESVAVAAGHMTDVPERSSPRFPEHAVPGVEREIDEVFSSWGLGPADLLICGGARGADLLAARAARRRGATVWLLLANDPDEFEVGSVAGANGSWIEEFRALLHRVPSWVLDDPPTGEGTSIYPATNAWMVSVATAQAAGGPWRVLAVWDGRTGEGPGGVDDLIERANAAGARMTIIDPAQVGDRRVERGHRVHDRVMLTSILAGAAAGAAGTTALNTVTYLDMAGRARPSSSTPEDTVERLADKVHVRIPGTGDDRKNRVAGLGPLTGIAAGVGMGALLGVLRRFGWRPSWLVGTAAATALALVGTNGPMTALGVTDPRTWSTADWVSDIVPHVVYGAVVHSTLNALS